MQLLIARHAKSNPADGGVRDFDRDLAPRGERDAPRMGAWLADQGLVPDWAVTSDALRTRRTTAALAAALGIPEHVTVADHRCYLATAADLLDVLRELPDGLARVLVVGHNPGVSELVWLLTGDATAHDLPTMGVALLTTDTAAPADLAPDCAMLAGLWTPKSLREPR